MRASEVEINRFKSIDELYKFIDDNAFSLELNWDITDIWVRYRNFTLEEDEKQKAQWEIESFLFDVKGKQIFSQVYSVDSSIEEAKKYPDLKEFQVKQIVYIKQRASSSCNPLLIARYNHLLWKCPRGVKNNQYAISAINNYISAINKGYQFYLISKHKEGPYQIGRLYESLTAICNEINTELNSLKNLTKFLLFNTKLDFNSLHGILKDMLEFPKIFKAADFSDTLSLFEKVLRKKRKKSEDFILVANQIPTAIKIAKKIKSDVKKWHNESGLAHLRIAEQEKREDSLWIKQSYYAKAINAFTLAGNKAKIKEAKQLYSDIRPLVKLSNVRFDFGLEERKELDEFQNYLKKLAEKLLEKPQYEIYREISNGKFFPNYSSLVKASKNNKNSFLDFVTIINFDNNKNIIEPPPEEEKESKILEAYGQHLNICVLPFLHYIIINGIKQGKLTFESLITFLVEKSWIGKPYNKMDLGGEERIINWVGLLSPSIIDFFVQIQAWVNSKYYTPNFVLCIDSLSLKIEGLLRDFCERAKIPTIENKTKGIQETFINNILDNETLKKHFNENDILFFDYMFSSRKGGLNLRNNVAHCFYNYREYNPDYMLLLIAVLLRLAKYNYAEVGTTL